LDAVVVEVLLLLVVVCVMSEKDRTKKTAEAGPIYGS
jgi:hypothetical protein